MPFHSVAAKRSRTASGRTRSERRFPIAYLGLRLVSLAKDPRDRAGIRGGPPAALANTLPPNSDPEVSMAETSINRRRWLWLILSAVLILIGGPIVWRLRPLNALEKRLVGEWQYYRGLYNSPSVAFTLHADRTIRRGESTGHWHASDGKLFLSFSIGSALRTQPGSFWQRLDLAWQGFWSVRPEPVIFDDHGRVPLSYGTFTVFPDGD